MEERKYYEVYPQNDDSLIPVNLDKGHMPFKVLAHPELLRKYLAGEKIDPIHIRVGLTNSCNLRCNFCNFHSLNESDFYDEFSFQDKINVDKMKKFIKEFKENGGKAITFCGSGESTTYEGYKEVCYYAAKCGVEVGLITNGVKLCDFKILECIRDTHTWIRIGLNAGSKESYQKITNSKKENFENILNAIEYLSQKAKRTEFKVGVNFVITLQNYHEIYLAGERAKKAGASYIRFEPEFYSALAHKTIYNKMQEINAALKKVSELSDSTFEVSIPKLNRGAMTKTDLVEGDFKKCHYCNFVTALGANGCIYPCPQIHLNSDYNMGNAIEMGYTSWINSQQKEEWLKNNGDRTQNCKTCFYRPQNELLEKLVNGDLVLDSVLEQYAKEHKETIHKNFV